MKIICYRTGGGESPENTIIGIEHCQKVKPEWPIEIDLTLTKDGEVILFHDSSTQRITGEDKIISESTYQDIKELNAGFYFEKDGIHPFRESPLKIPLLTDILDQFPNVDFIFDIHTTNLDIVDKLISIVSTYRPEKVITVVSGNDDIIAEFKKKEPNWKYAAATREAKQLIYSSFIFLDSFFPLQSDYLMIPKQYGSIKVLTKRIIKHVKSRNKQIMAWIYEGESVKTVETKQQFNELFELGIDGIFTDFPEKLGQELSQ